jgi:hypothetical protein
MRCQQFFFQAAILFIAFLSMFENERLPCDLGSLWFQGKLLGLFVSHFLG